jgi:hypothetical protein
MPRRVLTVDASHIRRHRLETEEGRRAFLQTRMPDHEKWSSELHVHPVTGARHLVLDHEEPETPLSALQPYHHGRPLVHQGGSPRIGCREPGCQEKALQGTQHCPVHLQPPAGYR